MKKYKSIGFGVLGLAIGFSAFNCRINQKPETHLNQQDNSNNAQTVAQNDNFDACTLISDDEIVAVQADQITKKTNSSKTDKSLTVSQCFYQLNDSAKSISLQITRSAQDASESPDIEEIWEKQYKRQPEADNDREEEEEKAEKNQTGDEKIADNDQFIVPNLGDETIHIGNGISETFYVLKGNNILRIGIGGKDDRKVRFEKLKKLTEYALKRL